MPRDSQGLYTLPSGNPVVAGTLIEAAWANPTMSDVAQALTDSLPRNGSAPMVGPLTLTSTPPTNPRHATSKAYVDAFVAFSTGMPIGSIVAYPSGVMPSGFLLCNGQQVNKTTYAALFSLIGTTFGADTPTTFALPDLRDQFIRGRNPATRANGSVQASTFASHNHGVNDSGHIHEITDPQHSHLQNPHTHTDTGHAHTFTLTNVFAGNNAGSNGNNVSQTPGVNTGVGVANIQNATAVNNPSSTGVAVNSATTGVTTAAEGGAETRPQNIALDYYIKAVNDSTASLGLTGISSSDTQMIDIDSTNSAIPQLDIKSNIAFGIPKLDANAKLSPGQMPFGALNYQGPWDASTGQTPSDVYPTTTFLDGDMYQVAVQGTLTVWSADGTLGPVLCGVGSQIIYMTDSPTLPVPGWFYNPPLTLGAVGAAQVSFNPFVAGGIAANNVQTAIEEVATERVPLNGTGATGTWGIGISGNAATATLATNATNAANATNATTAVTATGNAATATNPQGGGAFITSLNIVNQNVASAGYSKQVPVSATAGNLSAADAGKCVNLTAGMTITNGVMTAGDAVSFYNDTAAPVTLTQGGTMVLRIPGAATGANRTLAAYSQCTVWFKDTATGVVTGSGVA